MIGSHLYETLFEQWTFWRIMAALLVVSILRLAIGYLKVWLFLRECRTKYNALPVFKFPTGLPQHLEADHDDALSAEKKNMKENPKCRLIATHFGTTKLIFLIEPALLKAFFSDPARYKKGRMFSLYDEFVGKGLVFSSGKMWKKHRKLISETFRFEFIASQIPTIGRISKIMFEKELTETKGKSMNVLDFYQRTLGEIVFQIFFGSDLTNASIKGETPTKFLSRFDILMYQNALSLENVLFGLKGIKARLFKRNREFFEMAKDINHFIIGIIQERKKKIADGVSMSGTKDFLHILLEAQKLNQGTEDEFTDEEVLQEFLTFFVAGMDTTGHLLAMVTYFYDISTKEVKEALMKEAECLVKETEEITPEKLNKVETLAAFIKETLRMAPPAPMLFEREAVEDHYLGNVRIPKGTYVNCSFVSNNFNPEYFKAPEKFNLNRWIPRHEDFDEKPTKDPFIFTPFSAGPRNCIGQHFAMIEAKIMFSIFIANFKFTIPKQYKMRLRQLFLYGPRDPFLIDVESRSENVPGQSFKCK